MSDIFKKASHDRDLTKLLITTLPYSVTPLFRYDRKRVILKWRQSRQEKGVTGGTRSANPAHGDLWLQKRGWPHREGRSRQMGQTPNCEAY